MKKNLLSLSIAAIASVGFIGAANAANSVAGTGPNGYTAVGTGASDNKMTATNATGIALNPDGLGHALLVPYFTTQNGNSTLLSLVNTDTVNGKAVKVRFRGAANSDDIFDFQVYLSPNDVWTANVSQGADGLSRLTTTDRTCTLPANVNQAFVTARLPNPTSAAAAEQTREGYVEIFNMADVPPTTARTNSTANPLFTTIKHVNGVAPCGTTTAGATALNALGTAVSDEANARAKGLDTPSGGLLASWTVINVQGASVAWSGKATALTTTGGSRGRMVFSPQNADPVPVTAGSPVNMLTNDPLLRVPVIGSAKIVARNFDFPDFSTPYTGSSALTASSLDHKDPSVQNNSVGSALAVTSVINEYLTDPSISAATDWTFTFPTRRYAVARDYNASSVAGSIIFSTALKTANIDAIAPASSTAAEAGTNASFASQYFTPANTALGAVGTARASLICVNPGGSVGTYDREERDNVAFVISPGGTSLELCGESNVLAFNAVGGSSVLGSTIARADIDVGSFRDGLVTIGTPGLAQNPGAGANTTGGTFKTGLPVIGNAFSRATGPLVTGRSTNFGVSTDHRYTRN